MKKKETKRWFHTFREFWWRQGQKRPSMWNKNANTQTHWDLRTRSPATAAWSTSLQGHAASALLPVHRQTQKTWLGWDSSGKTKSAASRTYVWNAYVQKSLYIFLLLDTDNEKALPLGRTLAGSQDIGALLVWPTAEAFYVTATPARSN